MYLDFRRNVGRRMLSIGTTKAIILYMRSCTYIFKYVPGPVLQSCLFFLKFEDINNTNYALISLKHVIQSSETTT